MKLIKALNILRHYQLWRLGEEVSMLQPKVVTQAINTILKNFKEVYTKQEFLDAAEFGEVSMIDAKHVVSLLDEVREKNKI
jgi:L-lysine 2,3-aminomutase